MRGNEHAPFAGWTPELIEMACNEYEARAAEIDRIRHDAYAEGRKDEREEADKMGQALEDLRAEALEIFEPCGQEARDAIEWFASSIAVILTKHDQGAL